MGDWTFFSNYGHVLVCLAKSREVRLRDVAAEVGITERAVQKIVRDLQDAGYITISKQGRCNRYRINRRKTLRHSLHSHCTIGKLLTLLAKPARPGRNAQPGPEPIPEESPVVNDLSVSEEQSAPAERSGTQPASSAADKVKKPKKKEDKTKPLDTRQQGSLF